MISETKLDNFPIDQFYIDGFGLPIRRDRDKHGGGIMLYTGENVPIKLLLSEATPSEGFYVEINLYKKKWLINCSYNPEKGNISNHIAAMRKSLDLHSTKYENIMVLTDFNVKVRNKGMMDFCKSYNSRSLITRTTCFKNLENPSCIDLVLTNSPYSFLIRIVIEMFAAFS